MEPKKNSPLYEGGADAEGVGVVVLDLKPPLRLRHLPFVRGGKNLSFHVETGII